MDYGELIEHLRRRGLGNGSALGPHSGLYDEAATAIETLCAALARVTAERDAAIEDLLDAAITPCSYCKQNPNNGGACDMDNDNHEMFSCWEWRGIEED